VADTYFDPLAASAGVAPDGPTPYGSAVLQSLVNLGLAPGRIAQGQRLENVGQYSDLDEAQRQVNLDALMKGAPAIALTMVGTGSPFAAEGALGAAGAKGIRAYHGSPHDFERFDMSKIGSGEGAQAYGHGLYFAENPGTAQSYKEALAQRGLTVPESIADNILQTPGYGREKGIAYLQARMEANKNVPGFPVQQEEYRQAIDILKSGWEAPKGRMYEVQINAEPEHFLDWDKPLTPDMQRQLAPIIEQTKKSFPRLTDNEELTGPLRGQDLYRAYSAHRAHPDFASEALREAGIPGIKYLDQGSRGDTAAYTQAMKEAADLEAKGHPEWAAARRAEAEAIRGSQTRNYVLFRDDIIDILRKYGIAAPVAAGLAEQMGAPERPAQRQ